MYVCMCKHYKAITYLLTDATQKPERNTYNISKQEKIVYFKYSESKQARTRDKAFNSAKNVSFICYII